MCVRCSNPLQGNEMGSIIIVFSYLSATTTWDCAGVTTVSCAQFWANLEERSANPKRRHILKSSTARQKELERASLLPDASPSLVPVCCLPVRQQQPRREGERRRDSSEGMKKKGVPVFRRHLKKKKHFLIGVPKIVCTCSGNAYEFYYYYYTRSTPCEVLTPKLFNRYISHQREHTTRLFEIKITTPKFHKKREGSIYLCIYLCSISLYLVY